MGVSGVPLLVATAALLALPGAAGADDVMTYVHHPPESQNDTRYVYAWEILRTALERTVGTWGAYRMAASEVMSEERQAFELARASGKLTVMYLDTNPRRERELIPIRIPVDRDLIGYRVFLIRRELQSRFDDVRTLDDLRNLRIGQGLDWGDVAILRSAAFTVVTGSSYEGLFEMLIHGRFEAFSRAVSEVVDEYEQRKGALPDLHIEEHVLLYYPLPTYFWFSRTEEGRRLAKRAEAGMLAMIRDGTYDRIFSKYYRRNIERLRLRERRLFKIDNPFLGPETPFGDGRLWFDPATYR